MRVNVEVYGDLRRFIRDGQSPIDLEVDENTTVEGVLLKLGIDLMHPWNASLNGKLANASDIVSEGSVLIVFPPIAGGAGCCDTR